MGPGRFCWSYWGNPFCRSLDGKQNRKNAYQARLRFRTHTSGRTVRSTQDVIRTPHTAHRFVKKKIYTYRYACWSLGRGKTLDWPLLWYPPKRPPPEYGALGHRNNKHHHSRSGRACRRRRARQPAAPSPRLGSRSHGGRLSGNLRLPQGSADCDDLYRARASFPCLVPSFSSCDASVASASHVASGPSRYHSGLQSSTPSRPKLQ